MRQIDWLVTFLLAILFGAAMAGAEVRDQAHFFSDSAIDQATRTISQIDSQYHKQVVIETFPSIPSDLQGSYNAAQKDQFFDQWAKQRFGAAGVNGIYVLICKDPPYLKPEVGAKTGQKAFTLADSRELGQKMLADFKQRQFDQGLTDGLNFIQSTLAAHANEVRTQGNSATPSYPPVNTQQSYPPPYSQRTSSSSSGIGWFGLIVIFIIIVFVIRLFRGFLGNFGGGMSNMAGPSNYGGGYGGYGYGGGGGGGGFGRGFLGGLLGGAAGSWLYDRERGNTGIWGGGNSGPMDTGSGGGGFGGGGDVFGGNDAGTPMSGDSGGGGFGDSGGGGGGGGGDSGGGGF
ncbi:MAG: TPM domain-containing protein [Phycisphaerae bacterium]|nr:TPM domain-containing protein [Phycisphaerae bacterium]